MIWPCSGLKRTPSEKGTIQDPRVKRRKKVKKVKNRKSAENLFYISSAMEGGGIKGDSEIEGLSE